MLGIEWVSRVAGFQLPRLESPSVPKVAEKRIKETQEALFKYSTMMNLQAQRIKNILTPKPHTVDKAGKARVDSPFNKPDKVTISPKAINLHASDPSWELELQIERNVTMPKAFRWDFY